MRQHHDHIYSIFDGDRKGIPVISFVINFNDGYDGADLVFWDDYGTIRERRHSYVPLTVSLST